MRALRWVVACAAVLGCAPREEFCRSNISCEDASCEPEPGSCITFEEASELAAQPNSGVHTLTVRREPAGTAAAIPNAQNDDAICRGDTCYVRLRGQVAIQAVPSPGQFFAGWSGCSDSVSPSLTLTNLRADTVCTARFGNALIVVTAGVVGMYRGQVQLTSSDGCSATNSCVVRSGGSMTLVAPERESFRFLGWSGCSMSTERTLVLSNLTETPPFCIARFEAIGHEISWSASEGGSVRVTLSSPDNVCGASSCTVIEHGALTLEAEPAPGYAFASWSCGDLTTPELALLDVTADLACEARFVSAQ